MSIAMPTVSMSAQALIDARLDTIEQSLFGRMPRTDRLTIVREVESQIHELLAERGVDEATREDVLAVLARLDPPEAYLNDDESAGADRVGRRPASRPASADDSSPRKKSKTDRLSLACGIIGLTGLAMLLGEVMVYVLIFAVGANINNNVLAALLEISLIGLPVLVLTTSLISIFMAAFTRLRSGWSITGLVAGVVNFLGAIGLLARLVMGI